MNYLQEHYDYLSNLGKGILVCYHDNMVEIQELDNLSSESAKDIIDIEKDFVSTKEIKEKVWSEWRKEYYTETKRKYNWYLRDENVIIKGIDDFTKDYPYFPLTDMAKEIENNYWGYRQKTSEYAKAQAMCLAVKYPQL